MPFMIRLKEEIQKSCPRHAPKESRDYGEISIGASVLGCSTHLPHDGAQAISLTLIVVCAEAISNVPDRLNEPMFHVVDLATQSSDVDVHRPCAPIVIVGPDRL